MLNRRQVSFFLNELNHPSNAKQERLANKQTRTLLPAATGEENRTQEWNGAEELRKKALERRV